MPAPETTPQPKPEPLEVRGVTQRDYQHWLHSPVTEWFLQYLREYRADLLAAAQNEWLAGRLELSTADEMKGRANCLGEVAELPFSAIAEFYQQLDQIVTQRATEENDATEASENGT